MRPSGFPKLGEKDERVEERKLRDGRRRLGYSRAGELVREECGQREMADSRNVARGDARDGKRHGTTAVAELEALIGKAERLTLPLLLRYGGGG
mmetsp:Transcript_3496/g.9592  ORF Transcript_3496/g.9592 Transcript_3496/m.9592 type:complete len:94 (-) Transcript_3496:700-981(-)